jgi:Na+-transporting methylmalonyl-CoA/oxaloacetate decarboxylase gamma subunit
MIGAGDIKLLMVVGSYLGSSSMLRVMGISCVIAAVLSFMKVLVYGIGRKRKRYFLDYCRQVSVKGRIIPYIKKEDMDRNACWLFHLSLPILLAVVFELLWQM